MSVIQRHHTNPRLSKIVRHGGLVYLCGQTAKGSDSAPDDIAAQTSEVLSRIEALLTEAGSGPQWLLSATVYLRFAGMNAVWEEWLSANKAEAPVRTTVEAALATDGLRVEITVIAAEGSAYRYPS